MQTQQLQTRIMGSPCSDDDEEFYKAIADGEEIQTLRLQDERRLIQRIVHEDGSGRNSHGFYCFSEGMPT